MHLFVLLDEEAQVEARFGLFGDSANLDERWVHGLQGTYHLLGNQFGCTRWNSLMTCVLWNLTLVCLEIVLASVQDMSKVCLRNHFGSTCWYFGEEAQVEARFDMFGDNANLDAR